MTTSALKWRRPHIGGRTVLVVILAAATLVSLLGVDVADGVIRLRGVTAMVEIAGAAFRPDLSPGFLLTVLGAVMVTLGYAVCAMTLAIGLGIPAAIVISGSMSKGGKIHRALAVGTRFILAALRSMHELVWALLFVAVLGLTPWAGVLAIGIPYAGAVGRVLGDQLQDVPRDPLTALRSAGASPIQTLLYGRIPHVGADALGYLSYRFECAIRSAAVLSFIGLGGIGYRIEIALADINFSQVWTLVYALVLIIVAVDAATTRMRRSMTI